MMFYCRYRTMNSRLQPIEIAGQGAVDFESEEERRQDQDAEDTMVSILIQGASATMHNCRRKGVVRVLLANN